jgi:hypothetical protein
VRSSSGAGAARLPPLSSGSGRPRPRRDRSHNSHNATALERRARRSSAAPQRRQSSAALLFETRGVLAFGDGLISVVLARRLRLEMVIRVSTTAGCGLEMLLRSGLSVSLYGWRRMKSSILGTVNANKPRSGAYKRPFLISSLRATDMSDVRGLPIALAMSATAAASSPPIPASTRSRSR